MQKLFILLLSIGFCLTSYAEGNEGYLGVSVKSYEIDAQDGLRIVNIFDDGAALVADLRENDVITQVNGFNVTKAIELKNIIQQLQWGDKIEVDFVRDGLTSTKFVTLGHKATKKTYEILKSEQLENLENWYFNDNTTLVLKEGSPVSITKKINEANETIDLTQYTDFSQLPQNFMDVGDKLFIIEKTKEDQANRNSTANNIVVIKEVVSVDVTSTIDVLNYEEFNVFPNPSDGNFNVVLKAENLAKDLSWVIYDIQGRNVAQGEDTSVDGEFRKDVSLDVAAGTYLLFIQSGDQKVRQKFVIN